MRNWFARLMSSGRTAPPAEAQEQDLLRRGSEFERTGKHGEAEECYRKLLSAQPEHPDARRRLAQLAAVQAYAHQQRGEFGQAIEGYEESLALDHGQARVHNNLGNIHKELGRLADAVAAYREAVSVEPGLAEAQLNLGTSLYQLTGETAQPMAHLRLALEQAPTLADASLNLGFLLEQEGDAHGARQCYLDAIASDPDHAEAHFNYALQSLLRGDFATGWREYEWRTRRPDVRDSVPHAGRPRWDGSALAGRAILLYGEQGFGDVIQFARFASVVAERGGRVVVSCQPKLQALVGTVPGIAQVVGSAEPPPAFDVCCSLLSLPLVLGTTLESLPARVPYMRAEPARVERWKARVAGDGAFKVGLFWSTETNARFAALKSFDLEKLAPLGAISGVTFYSLQRGAAARQAAQPPAGMRLVDLSAELTGFDDDAGLMANLDLVISIDTATAHLAGALGRPVWILTHFPPEWRWLTGREDSPWYPTMRIFRQGKAQPWEEVIERVAKALREARRNA